jgi:hypothetical protein
MSQPSSSSLRNLRSKNPPLNVPYKYPRSATTAMVKGANDRDEATDIFGPNVHVRMELAVLKRFEDESSAHPWYSVSSSGYRG